MDSKEILAETAAPEDRRLSPGMPAYDTSWTALEDVDLPSGLFLCTNYAARAGLPGRFRDARRVAAAVADATGGR